MLSSSRVLRSGGGVSDFRASPKVTDAFQHVLLRNRWAFDHVAVDVGYLCAVASRFTRDLIGSDRDAEAVKIVHKQVQNQVLRRLGGNKSLALMLDGSEPLWKVQHMRMYPGKRFSEKFYRSAASPMVYLLEERLRGVGPDLRPAPIEFILSGPGVPGPAEGKMSSWMLDLATRVPHRAVNPASAAAITPNDSICLVGHTDLFLNVLGATPFHNITAVTFNAGEVKSLSLRDCMEWLRLGDLLDNDSLASAAANPTEANVKQQKLAAVRTDIVLLYLMSSGTTTTNLPAFGVNFTDLMDAYLAELESFAPATITTASGAKYFSGLLFDEHPLTTAAGGGPSSSLPSMRLKPEALARVLTRAAKRPITYPSRHCQKSVEYVEVLLQTHAMLTCGSVQNNQWVPDEAAENVPEKAPKIPLDQFIGHLRAAAAAGAGPDGGPVYIVPSRSRSFALTGLESLLLTSPEADIIDQVVPMYARGHTLPAGVAKSIVDTRNIFTALEQSRAALSGLVASAPSHPAAVHAPTHYLARTAGARGPPPGWTYLSVNMGLKAEAMNIRYSLNASDTAMLREATSAASSGLSKRNHLHVFAAAGGEWVEVPCDRVGSIGEGSTAETDKTTMDDSSPSAAAETAVVSTLRVLTWNTQFDRHSGERTPLGREGIDWCTRTRFPALSKVLEAADADVIAMQEVEPAWCRFLAAQPWVQAGYAMSCQEGSHAISPWGVLMLVRRSLPITAFDHANVPAFSGHTSVMPEVTIPLGPHAPPVVIGSMHLLAPYSQNNVNNRETQLHNLAKHLREAGTKTSAGSTAARVVMGDFNDSPTKFFRFPSELGFKDAWESLHPRCNDVPPPVSATADPAGPEDAEERGYTINGAANPYAGRIIEPEFFGRADRVMYAAKHLQPVHAELVGTAPVLEVLREEGVTNLVERPQEAIPDYLFPSDHFGVLVEFQVV